ncbi:hypothetical protein ACGFRB_07575 [Streptomyces sp. NPDC048718]|uniref:hypothetical protein n=1 Tax=Streptomyces sp. NPDC048718 TaxID=3365587 RepID=UPI003712518B
MADIPMRMSSVRENVSRMNGQEEAGVRAYVLTDGASPADVVRVHREALRVLRPGIDVAHIDVYSDAPWPPEVLPSCERALSLAREGVARGSRSRRADPGMGIDLDPRDDGQFAVLTDLAPYTIHAEAWGGGRPVFSADDSGTALWIEATREQEAALEARLSLLGIGWDVLAVHASRR